MKQRKYLEIFAREAGDILRALRQGLLAMEAEGSSREGMQALLRHAHTLKGSARMLDLKEIGGIAHKLEDIFREVEEGSRSLSPELIDQLLQATDSLEALIGSAGEEEGPPDVQEVLRILEGPTAASPAESAPAEMKNGPAPAADETGETIRVNVERLDTLVNLLGEVLIRGRKDLERERRLRRIEEDLEGFLATMRREENASRVGGILGSVQDMRRELGRDALEFSALSALLHDEALMLRMLPLTIITDDLRRLVRDLAREQRKEIHLAVSGEQVELDRLLLEALRPMLMHMVRNAIDHGIEDPDERRRAGKPAEGKIVLEARYERSGVVLRLADDGRGIDPQTVRQVAVEKRLLTPEEAAGLPDAEALYLILRPGFTTRRIITDVSGRGVGMDVVKANTDRVKGNLTIRSQPGEGTEFHLEVPLSLALVNGLEIDCGGERFIVPLQYVGEVLRFSAGSILSEGGREVVRVGGTTVPLISLGEALGLPSLRQSTLQSGVSALLLRFRERQIACVIDRSLGVDEFVVKGMGSQLRRVPCFSGVTIRDDGLPALILSVPDLFSIALTRGGTRLRETFEQEKKRAVRGEVLVVDDSITTRTMEKNILESQGYRVAVAISGEEALSRVAEKSFDLVVTDIEMPGMDGFELTRRLREREQTRETPVIIVSSRTSDEDKRRGIEVGAQAYIVKGAFDQGALLQTVEALIE